MVDSEKVGDVKVTDEKRLGSLEPASTSSVSVASSAGYGSSDEHIFKDPAVAQYWRGVFDKAKYENRHRFDPDFTWTAEEEKKLVRKVSRC